GAVGVVADRPGRDQLRGGDRAVVSGRRARRRAVGRVLLHRVAAADDGADRAPEGRAMSTVATGQASGRYARLMTSVLRGTLRLDVLVNKMYPTDFNQLYYIGGLSNLFILFLVMSGIFFFFYYDAI